jgi:hypothetical protein
MTGYLQMFDTLTWIPGVYWFALRLARRGRAGDWFGLAFFSALAYLSGDLEIVLYSWLLLLLLMSAVERTSAARLGMVGAGLLLSLLICAAPFLLTLHFLHLSYREIPGFHLRTNQWKFLGAFIAAFIPWVPRVKYIFWGYVGVLLPAGMLAAALDQR